jgi:hypothetical protein
MYITFEKLNMNIKWAHLYCEWDMITTVTSSCSGAGGGRETASSASLIICEAGEADVADVGIIAVDWARTSSEVGGFGLSHISHFMASGWEKK